MRLWVDFNEVEDDEQIVADLEFAAYFTTANLVPGASAELFDDGGHSCMGRVVSYDEKNREVTLRILWESWRSERETLHVPPSRTLVATGTTYQVA